MLLYNILFSHKERNKIQNTKICKEVDTGEKPGGGKDTFGWVGGCTQISGLAAFLCLWVKSSNFPQGVIPRPLSYVHQWKRTISPPALVVNLFLVVLKISKLSFEACLNDNLSLKISKISNKNIERVKVGKCFSRRCV